jgi:hypothetical protein
MALARTTFGPSADIGTADTTRAIAVTVPASATQIYAVFSGWTGNGGATIPSACDWNGAAMTKILESVNATSDRVQIWRLTSPAAATASVTLSGFSNIVGEFSVYVYTGGNTATPERNAGGSATGTSAAPSVAVTSQAGDEVIDVVAADGSVATTITAGAGQTSISNRLLGGELRGTSWEAGASSVTMSWTINTSATWSIASVSVAAAGGAVARRKMTPNRGIY